MIRIIDKIPHNVTIAFSGGIDSVVVTHFLRQGRRNIKLAFFNHDTQHSKTAEKFVQKYASDNNLDLVIGRVTGVKGRRRSLEEFWRDERYGYLNTLEREFIITCHHLDDCVETWLMSSIHGKPKLIPYHRAHNIYRPFLMTSRATIEKYAKKNNLTWIEDPSNQDLNYMRNLTRHKLVPEALKVNPGLRNTIRKKIVEKTRNI